MVCSFVVLGTFTDGNMCLENLRTSCSCLTVYDGCSDNIIWYRNFRVVSMIDFRNGGPTEKQTFFVKMRLRYY